MPARRAALALLGGTLAAALSGCLGDDTDDPPRRLGMTTRMEPGTAVRVVER